MRKVVLDTDVIIDYLRTGEGGFLELTKRSENREVRLFMSVITVIELYSGNDLQQRRLVDYILDRVTILAVDRKLAQMVGDERNRLGNSVGFADLIIGVACKTIDGELATRNKKHFERILGLKFFEV